MSILTAADYADTGQWRLIVRIYTTGIRADIENTIHKDLEPQLLFEVKWEHDADNLLRNIENAVYDHPRVLEDFSASIIVFDSKTLFMPTEVMEETEGAEENVYTSVYDVEPSEVMVDVDSDLTAAHCLTDGIKGFLNRTFPGAKLESNLMNRVRTLRKHNEGVKMYVVPRESEADYILLDGSNLISASTHAVSCEEDVAYHAFNIIDVYGYPLKHTIVELLESNDNDKLKGMIRSVKNAQ